jgi:hypothetical protein
MKRSWRRRVRSVRTFGVERLGGEDGEGAGAEEEEEDEDEGKKGDVGGHPDGGGGNDGGERRPRREEEKSVGGEGEAEEWLCFAMLLFLMSCEGEGWGD